MMNTIYVVNDRFLKFSEKHGKVYTVSEFRHFLANNDGTQPIDVVSGQGVDAEELHRLVRKFAGAPHVFHILPTRKRPKASFFEAHKHKVRNIIVSLAERVSPAEFVMDLYFDGDNEFFDDHMSGQHIQGMGITEAARQAFLCVTEQFYLPGALPQYFVIHRMETEFRAFVFPLDAQARYFVLSEKRGAKGNISMDARIEIWQAGSICAVCQVAFTAFEVGWISERTSAPGPVRPCRPSAGGSWPAPAARRRPTR